MHGKLESIISYLSSLPTTADLATLRIVDALALVEISESGVITLSATGRSIVSRYTHADPEIDMMQTAR